ncbi:hypothetical protein GQ457_03G017010 [Hibiscus cannabinus]
MDIKNKTQNRHTPLPATSSRRQRHCSDRRPTLLRPPPTGSPTWAGRDLDRWIISDPTVEISLGSNGSDDDAWQHGCLTRGKGETDGHFFWRDSFWAIGSDLIQRWR